MARTIAFAAGLGALVGWNWGRLEQARPSVGPLVLMVLLGIAPSLLPSKRWRLAGALAVLFVAAPIALDVSRPYGLGELSSRAGRGFLDFYDVLVPFNGPAHPLMHDVTLLAVFVFTALGALAVASRRPLAASLVLVAGAGWPATILPGTDDLARGATLLVAALAMVAWLRPSARRVPPQILAGAGLVILALIFSSSGAVAKSQFLDWQNWNLSKKAGKRVGVEYVWKSNYNGIRFPRKRTQVFTVSAPARSVYWRATTLDTFAHDVWDEDLVPRFTEVNSNHVDLAGDPLLPADARNKARWNRADVRIDALRDAHLVGPAQPVQYATNSIGAVEYEQGGVARAFSALPRGTEYTVWAYAPQPQPTPKALASSPANYPAEIAFDGRYLGLFRGGTVPPFGTAEHAAWAQDYFANDSDGIRYRPLYDVANRIAGKATNPYAAAVAIEAWLRSSGNFTYDEQPPHARGMPPLVQFVTTSKRGYCQHFAGAMALMLRYLGIPTRVAAGFTSGRYDKANGTWNVYDRDAHTWVEVWFRGYGWLPFDPTPGRGTLGGSYTTSSISFDAGGALKVLAASALAGRRLLHFELGPGGKAARAKAAGAGNATADRGGAGTAGGKRGVGVASIVAVVGLVAVFFLFVLGKLTLRRRRLLTEEPRELAAACRREVVDFLADQRIDVPRSIGPRELGGLLSKRVGVEASSFAEAVGLARFGPASTAPRAARDARRELRTVHRRLRRALPLGRRVRGLFSVRSLLS
ncbi:MAG TPA: transglutaminase domain-containing protein [Gaiellaceae bacterium]|nr:transglutaminase domain-containing protein [Gaiellaceae bacterium]